MRSLAVGLILATVVTQVASAKSSTAVVIRVKSVQTSSVSHDKPPSGLSLGDVIVEHDRLLNIGSQFGKPTNAVVGSDVGTLTVVSSTRAKVTATATLPLGTIKISGTISLNATGSISVPVIGGTGAYAHARGFYVEPPSGGSAGETNTYHLVIP